jgi:hypothetical protein
MNNPAFADAVKEAAKIAASYVHSCQVEDGGYFFARIPPSSLRDTYFAVRTLHLLGQHPQRPTTLESFVRSSLGEDSGTDAHAIYLSIEILGLLSQQTDSLRPRIQALLGSSELADDPGKLDTLYLEVVSELEHTLELVSLLVHFGLPFDRERIVNSICALSNADGGFGRQGTSTLATTYYAVQALSMLGHSLNEREHALAFLGDRGRNLYFLEDLYYLETTRSMLGVASSDTEQVISFVLDCQRIGGGFARARPMGIPTLEYTYYAVSILKLLGTL